MKIVGQNFWTFISGSKTLFTDIIEPLGYEAKVHNDQYIETHDRMTNLLTKQFLDNFCDITGEIDWDKLVKANSGNYDLQKHGFNFDPQPLDEG